MNFCIYHPVKKCFANTALLGLFAAMFLFNSCKTNRTEVASSRILFEAGDTQDFDSWEIKPGKNSELNAYKMVRRDNKWMISVNGSEYAEPDTAYLRRSLQHISKLQAVTELNIPQKNWDTLQVTDKDAKLVIYKDGKPLTEIFLGKMFFNKANKTTYYVRLKDEDKVYTVQQYLEGSFKVPAEKLRKKQMVDVNQSQISEIMFLKPEGIDFVMLRAGQMAWSIDGILTTDTVAVKYVNALSKLQIVKFAETPTMGASLSIQVTTYPGKQISLRAFRKNSDTWILSSSANEGNYMEMSQQDMEALFPGRDYFMKAVKE